MNFTNFLDDLIFTDKEIETFVSEELPKWKKECDTNPDGKVSFHQAEFGNSVKELLLLALAVKHAKRLGKEVTVMLDENNAQSTSSVR